MIEGFKTYTPVRANAYSVTISKAALCVGGGWRYLLTAESYNLGNDGGKRFVLEPAKDKEGAVTLHSYSKSTNSLRCTKRDVLAFIRRKLGLKDAERLTMRAKDVDGVLMFGVLDGDVR